MNILYLCTGNSARSIMAEAITGKLGRGRLHGFSAGSHPTGRVNPHALELLMSLGYDTLSLRSKSWNEFARPGAPQMDIVITVCDDAASEVCPIWPGKPATAHWPMRDPAAAAGRQLRPALAETLRLLEMRISALVDLPFEQLEDSELRRRLREIGHIGMPVVTL